MDPSFISRIKENTPEFNRSVVEGLAVEHLMSRHPETGQLNAVAYIDRLIEINSSMFPEGLKYEGSEICTPLEQFREMTREHESRRIANIARSDVYMIKLLFSFKGELLYPRYVLFPYVSRGGILWLNGALYNIAPVLTDVGFSVTRRGIFIQFPKTKLNFNRIDHHYFCNGRREVVYIIWSNIHKQKNKLQKSNIDNRDDIHTSLTHYFFAKFGVKKTFKKWAKASVKIAHRSQIDMRKYPKEDYLVFESSHLRTHHPAGDICLIVPRKEDSDFLRMLVGGYFYVADTFPNQLSNIEYIDDPIQWQRLLGRLIFGDYEPEGLLLENIETHMHGFNQSLDEITRDELRERGVKVNNIWDLLYSIMTDLSMHFYKTTEDEASMFSKRLVTLRYVFSGLNRVISLFVYGFQSYRKDWTADEINAELKRAIKPKVGIAQLESRHGEVNVVSYPGDNMGFKITSMLVPQESTEKGRVGEVNHNDPSRLLHSSIAAVGQYNNQPKSDPDGRARINPCVRTEVDGLIKPDLKRAELLERVQKQFRRDYS